MAVKASGSVTVASITDVVSTTRYYLLQASTLTAPAKPTANPPGGSWSAAEPTYTEGSTNSLYTCDLTTFSDGTWAYSAVSLSTSYEASKTAYNKAVAAANTAAATAQSVWTTSSGTDQGLHVSSTGDHDLSGANLLLTATKLAFRKVLAELLTVDAVNGVISFLGGLVTIRGVEWHRGGTDYEGVGMHSTEGTEITCDSSWDGEPARVAVGRTGPAGETGGCVYLEGQRIFAKDLSLATDGANASMAALWALLVGADTHITAGIDAVTLYKRIADAIQPVVLYNGGNALDYDTTPGAGTTGTVTLSEDASHFKEITVFFHYDVWACSSVTLTNPDGKTAGLYLMFVGADGNLWTKTRNIAIGGTSITNATNAANLATQLTDGSCLLAQSLPTPEIVIDRVEGRR